MLAQIKEVTKEISNVVINWMTTTHMYRIVGNFQMILFVKFLKMVNRFQKYFFEIAR